MPPQLVPPSESVALSPPARLAPYIERVWASRGALDAPRERIMPSGTADLVINLGAPMRFAQGALTRFEQVPTMCASGLLTRAALLEHPPIHAAVGVRLTPAGALAIFKAPMVELLDGFIELELLQPLLARKLGDALDKAHTLAAQAQAMMTTLEDALKHSQAPTPRDLMMLNLLTSSHGQLQLNHLSDMLNRSPRAIIQDLRRLTGLTPKQYAKQLRLRRAVGLLQRPSEGLAQVALEANYYDQAHMNHDFKALLGLTPAQCIGQLYSGQATLSEDAT